MLSKVQAYATFVLMLMVQWIMQQAMIVANYINQLRLAFKAKLALFITFVFSVFIPGIASADVPASVTAGITGAVSDVGTIGGLVMGVIIAIVAFVWLKRVLSGK